MIEDIWNLYFPLKNQGFKSCLHIFNKCGGV
uniref:Uncharacterized protein n=1 Tax=Medicago truncatula TaxID=3880 RepID=I3T8C2_MEDTR|nr:unknown [Medicago truncatula]